MSFIDHILAKHKFETVAVLILIAIFVVYIATRTVAIQVSAIPACFTVADQISAPPCTQGETVANGIDSSTGEFADPVGSGDQDCYCTVATISVGDRVGLASEGGILFTTDQGGVQTLTQDTSTTLFWQVANTFGPTGYLGIGTADPQSNIHVLGSDDGGFANILIQDELFGTGNPLAEVSLIAAAGDGGAGDGGGIVDPVSGVLLRAGDPLIDEISSGFFNNIDMGGFSSLGTSTNHPLNLITNNIERIKITSDGNVGIGTTNPTLGLLQVEGNIASSGLTPGVSCSFQVIDGSTNTAGRFRVTDTNVTDCTVTFNTQTPYVNTPVCIVTGSDPTITYVISTIDYSAFIITSSSDMNLVQVMYICIGI